MLQTFPFFKCVCVRERESRAQVQLTSAKLSRPLARGSTAPINRITQDEYQASKFNKGFTSSKVGGILIQ